MDFGGASGGQGRTFNIYIHHRLLISKQIYKKTCVFMPNIDQDVQIIEVSFFIERLCGSSVVDTMQAIELIVEERFPAFFLVIGDCAAYFIIRFHRTFDVYTCKV